MKSAFKRLTAMLLLVCLVSTFVVPATFADSGNAGGTAITYDFELYKNSEFIADATSLTVDAGKGYIATTFSAGAAYNGSGALVYNWIRDARPRASADTPGGVSLRGVTARAFMISGDLL